MNTLITAHSGCENTPANSLESIMAGIEAHADCVEIDVQLDRSGNLWLSHDQKQNYESAVPLTAALKLIADSGIAVNCDLKTPDALYPTLSVAHELNLNRTHLIFSGAVKGEMIKDDISITKNAQIYWNTEELADYWVRAFGADINANISDKYEWSDIVKPDPIRAEKAPAIAERQTHMNLICANIDEIGAFCQKVGVDTLNMPWQFMSNRRIETLHCAGLHISLWTVDDESAMSDLLYRKIGNITTRRPVRAVQIRG